MNKRYTWDSKTKHGQIHDEITNKNLHGSQETMHELNNLWEQVQRLEKQNQELIKENIRLREKEDYCDNLCNSYKQYYEIDIEDSEWYGYYGDING